MSKCASCGAELRWAETKNGKRIPLDVEPVINGNLELDGNTVRYVTPDANAVPMRYRSHFVGCPGAGPHRRKS